MYQKPALQRFGTFRDLTQAGCVGASDGFAVEGIGTSTGARPTGNVGDGDNAQFCFVASR